MSIHLCRAAKQLPLFLYGILLLLTASAEVAANSAISMQGLQASADEQADSLCFIQKDVTLHQKYAVSQVPENQVPETTVTFRPVPEGLDDWEKEFVTDRQSGPYYSDMVIASTTAVTTVAPLEATVAPKKAARTRDAFDVEEDSISFSIAASLFGVASTIMALVYVLCAHDVEKLAVSYGIVSSAMSAFMAALVYSSMKDLTSSLLWEYRKGPIEIQMTIDIVRFLLCFLVVEALLITFKNSDRELKAISLVGGYLCGFAAINAFEPFQHLYAFADTPFSSGTAVVLEAMCMSVLFAILRQLRHHLHRNVFFDPTSNDHWDRYLKAVEEVECTLLGISMGFLISRSVEFAALQKMPGGLPPPRGTWAANTGLREVTMMFGGFLFFGLIAACYATWAKFEWYGGHRKLDHAMQSFLFSACAWCGYTTVNYICSRGTVGQGTGGDLQWALVSAILISVLCCIGIAFIAQHAHPHSYSEEAGDFVPYHILLQSVGLLFGVAWACCYTRASSGAAALAGLATSQLFASATICFAFAVLIFMLWVFYIMPNADYKAFLGEVQVEEFGNKFGQPMHFGSASQGPKAWWPPQSWEAGPSQEH